MTLAQVTGTAVVEADPDEAHLRVRIEARAHRSAQEAYAEYAARLATARAVVDREGVEHWDDGVSTWSYLDERKRERHTVNGGVRVKVSDLAALASLVTDLLAHPDLELHGLTFDVSNRKELLRRARVEAIAAAREVAEDYAEALGATVSGVESVSDQRGADDYDVRPAAAAEMLRAMGRESGRGLPELELAVPEPIRITGRVDVTFTLTPLAT